MSKRIYSRIAGTGSYLPEKVLTNADLEKWSKPRMSGSSRAPVFVNGTSRPKANHQRPATTPPCARLKPQASMPRSST